MTRLIQQHLIGLIVGIPIRDAVVLEARSKQKCHSNDCLTSPCAFEPQIVSLQECAQTWEFDDGKYDCDFAHYDGLNELPRAPMKL